MHNLFFFSIFISVLILKVSSIYGNYQLDISKMNNNLPRTTGASLAQIAGCNHWALLNQELIRVDDRHPHDNHRLAPQGFPSMELPNLLLPYHLRRLANLQAAAPVINFYCPHQLKNPNPANWHPKKARTTLPAMETAWTTVQVVLMVVQHAIITIAGFHSWWSFTQAAPTICL